MGSVELSDAKVAIVTGSTSGIGKHVVEHLHSKGYRVVISGRRPELAEPIVAALDPTGASAVFQKCDVSSYESNTELFRSTFQRWGRIDVVVLNAGGVDKDSKFQLRTKPKGGIGGTPVTSVDDIPPVPSTGSIDEHLKACIYGTMLSVHFMRHSPKDCLRKIIVTGSMAGVHPIGTFPEYSAAKAGVHNWVRVMAPMLLLHEGIAMNSVLPGGVETNAMPGFNYAFKPEHLVPFPHLMAAYDMYLDDPNKRIGETVETGHKEYFYHKMPENLSGDFGRRTMSVYEPWFAMIHGARSDLPDALQDIQNPSGKRLADIL